MKSRIYSPTEGVLLPFFHTPYENRLHKTAYYRTLDPLIDELRHSQKTSLPSAKPSSAHCLLSANQPGRFAPKLLLSINGHEGRYATFGTPKKFWVAWKEELTADAENKQDG